MTYKSTMKRLGVLIIALQLLLPGLALAQCTNRCHLPPKKDRGECSIVVDANTGSIIEGSIRIPERCEQVQVYYVNKNPFKYVYTFTSKFVPYDTEAALAFLTLIGGDFAKGLSSATGQKSAIESASTPGDLQCTDANGTDAQALIDRANRLKDDSKRLADQLSAVAKPYSTYKDRQTKFFAASDDDFAFKEGSESCAELCTMARSLLTDFEALPDLDHLEPMIKAFQDQVSKLEQDLKNFNPSGAEGPACKLGTNREVSPRIDQGKEDIKNYSAALETLKQSRATLQQTAKLIRNGINGDFIEVVPAQKDDVRAGKLTLTIARKNVRNPDSKLDDRTLTLLMGEPSLFLTAGIGFSTIGDRHIIRQAGLVPDGSGGTKLGTVFGFEQNSNFKPSGVFMLNAPIWRSKKDVSIGPSAGLVLSSRNNTVEPEFIAGLSVGLLRNTVFITGGFHAARMENLAPGFNFGQEVPADLKDPLPVEKSFKGGAMFSITYRIK